MTNRFKPLPDSLRFPSENIKKKKNEIFIVEDVVTNTYNFQITLPIISKYYALILLDEKKLKFLRFSSFPKKNEKKIFTVREMQ